MVNRRPSRERTRRRWAFALVFLCLLGVPLFLIGLELWEMWVLVLGLYYVIWCTRKE